MELEPRTSAPAHATGAVEFVDLALVSGDTTFRLRDEGDVSALAASMGRLGQLVPLELRPLSREPGMAPRYQIVAGFRRVAALRLLRRERVLARIHRSLSDEDAWALALCQALLAEPMDRIGLDGLRERLASGDLAPWAAELVDEALVRAPVDPEVRERFLEFLQAPPGPPVAAPSDDVGLDGAQDAQDDQELAALDGAPEDAALEGEGTGQEETVEVTPEELTTDLVSRLYALNQDLAVAYESWSELPPAGRRDILEQAGWIARLVAALDEPEDEG